MMLKLLPSLTFVLLLFTLNSNAQCCGSQQKMKQEITASAYYSYSSRYEYTPFLSTDWHTANIKLVSGEVYSNLKIRLDLHKSNIIYYNEKLKKLLIIDRAIIDRVDIVNQENMVLNTVQIYTEAKSNQSKILFLHHDDSISLVSTHIKKVEKYNDVSRSTQYLGGYYSAIKYYAKIGDEFVGISLRKRSILRLYPEHKKELNSFISKNKLKTKNIANLGLVFEKINELERAN